MISADAAFENVANAAAAAFAAAPARISYRVAVHADTAPRAVDETHRALYRSTAGEASLADEDAPTRSDSAPATGAPAEPLPPVVDALADWAFRFDATGGSVRMTVAYQHPKRYALPTPGPGVDVVVASVSGYAVAYAGPGHVRLEPATAAVRQFAGGTDHFTYRDIWFDPATWLPSRIVLASPDETLALDYVVVAGHWLLGRLTYDGVAREHPPRHYRVEAAYDQFAFP